VIDGVGDGGSGADVADLAEALRAHRVDVRIVLVDPGDLKAADVGIDGDAVLGEVVVDKVAEARVQYALFVQRHR
jgi:hypothetical protein